MLLEHQQYVLDNYLSQTYLEIAQRLNLTKSCVASFLFDRKLKKGQFKKFSHNELYFSTLNNENSYWAGFLAADGFTRSKLNQLCLMLADKDIEHLKLFKDSIKYTGEIKVSSEKKKSSKYKQPIYHRCYVNICSAKNVINDLKTYFNITDCKSLTYIPPTTLEHNYKLSFIKGLIDGDGTIYVDSNNRLQFSICGTEETCNFICKEFDNLSPSKARSKPRRKNIKSDKNHFTYKVTGIRAYKILSLLNSVKTPILLRKWGSLDRCLTKRKLRKSL